MNNCSQHKKDLFGETDMHKIGEMIGNLHYQSLSELLINLAAKINEDAKMDELSGKTKLARELRFLSANLYSAEQAALNAWNISKPFMNQPCTHKNSSYNFALEQHYCPDCKKTI